MAIICVREPGNGDDVEREEEDKCGGQSLFTILFTCDIDLIGNKEERKERRKDNL